MLRTSWVQRQPIRAFEPRTKHHKTRRRIDRDEFDTHELHLDAQNTEAQLTWYDHQQC